MSEPQGQILPNSEFGDCLTEFAKECETILEIGTWRGLGSTLCLSKGLVRTTQRMWTVDQSFEMWMEAKSHYVSESRIRFLNARTVDVLDEIPINLDLVLFDGDDIQTDREFDLIIPIIEKFIALDDTNERKNARQLSTLSNSSKWEIIRGSETQRNGWAIFKRL